MIDTSSADWLTVKAHCERILKESNLILKSPGLPPVETEFHRGRIEVLERILDLPKRRQEAD